MKTIFITSIALLSIISCEQDDSLDSLTGKYHGTCIGLSSGLDFTTGLFYSDTIIYERTIKVFKVTLEKIELEGVAWESFSGSNDSDADTLSYGLNANQGIYWTIDLFTAEKKLIYRETRVNPSGPGGNFTTCSCYK